MAEARYILIISHLQILSLGTHNCLVDTTSKSSTPSPEIFLIQTLGHLVWLLLPIHDLEGSFPFPRTITKILSRERMGEFFPFSMLISVRH